MALPAIPAEPGEDGMSAIDGHKEWVASARQIVDYIDKHPELKPPGKFEVRIYIPDFEPQRFEDTVRALEVSLVWGYDDYVGRIRYFGDGHFIQVYTVSAEGRARWDAVDAEAKR